MKAWPLVFLLALRASAAWPAPAAPMADAVPAVDRLLIPGPPEFVCGPSVGELHWSPDGRYVLAVRRRPLVLKATDDSAEVSLHVWSRETASTRQVMRMPGEDWDIEETSWLPGAGVAFAVLRPGTPVNPDAAPTRPLWRIDARQGTAQSVATEPNEGLTISPSKPYGYLCGHDAQGAYLRPLTARGPAAGRIAAGVPEARPMLWSANGETLYLAVLSTGATPDDPAPEGPRFLAFHAPSRRFTRVPLLPTPDETPQQAPGFQLAKERLTLTAQTTGAARPLMAARNELAPLWLTQGEGKAAVRILIAPDVEDVQVAPTRDAVLFSSPQGAFVTPLVRVPRAALEEAQRRAEQARLTASAKQAALGLLMWSQDNDDALPPAGSDLADILRPYLRATDVLQGTEAADNAFVYTFGGGPVSDVKDPSATVLGYFNAPGGYAVAFVDGHVRIMEQLPEQP